MISADPSSVPLSLLVLVKQLSSQCQVLTNTFVHSSATDTPEKLRSFLQNGEQFKARSSYQLAITIVWKKGRIRESRKWCGRLISYGLGLWIERYQLWILVLGSNLLPSPLSFRVLGSVSSPSDKIDG